MKIQNHFLDGEGVIRTDTPNKGGTIVPEYLIVHYTAGSDAESSVAHFRDETSNASAHLVIGRDGRAWQLVPFNVKAWHAGVSSWGGREGMNNFSIGIELDNAGLLQKVGEEYQAWFGKRYPVSEIVWARHKNETEMACWHVFTQAQITLLLDLAKLLVAHYGLKDILGHDDIAPKRKLDPGPAFPMESFRAAVLGRKEDAQGVYRVTPSLLNVRSGPGAQFQTVAPPLPTGAQVQLLQMQSLWAKVLLTDGSQIEGWVRNSFIQKL
jgi:N-acetylmuramoyl-L-alanine amidase